MITLSQMHALDEGTVVKIDADGELKQRLFSFGLRKGSHLKVKAISIGKSTIEVEIGSTLMALRYSEAERISVEKL
jgi:ferrous iron transport protein A